jgi:uncharacterized membrane protein YfcA
MIYSSASKLQRGTRVIASLFLALGILTAAFVAGWAVLARRHGDTPDRGRPDAERIAVGFFANFFDALGIGSFATTTTYFRLRKLVRDELIPGSLNVGYALPTITQAFIGITLIAVEPWTLVLMIVTAVAGSWFGAGIVARLPRRGIQLGMGVALLIAAGFMFAKVTGLMPTDSVSTGRQAVVLRSGPMAEAAAVATLPPGTSLELVDPGREWSSVQVPAAGQSGFVQTSAVDGIVLGVTGTKLALGLVGSFLLGSIMPLGIGYYAPCMVLVAMLGMNLRVAFPIMMGACAFLMPISSIKFIRAGRYSLKTTIGMAIGGVFGSALALVVVKSLPLYYVMWLVTFVIIYTGVSLLRTAAREKAAVAPGQAPSAAG